MKTWIVSDCRVWFLQNGWDPNEMFKTNAERFDVKSSYDPSLSQYTWGNFSLFYIIMSDYDLTWTWAVNFPFSRGQFSRPKRWLAYLFLLYSLIFSSGRTPLKQENTLEYKKREAHAAKLAQEIERSESYKHRIALEVGDGDEEEKFSAVVRPGDQGGSSGKYVVKSSQTCMW